MKAHLSCFKSLQTIATSTHLQLAPEAKLTLFEILRKLKFLQPAETLAQHIKQELSLNIKLNNNLPENTASRFTINTAIIMFYLEEFEQSISTCKQIIDEYWQHKTLDIFPVLNLLSACYVQQGRYDIVIAVFREHTASFCQTQLKVEITRSMQFI